LLLAAVGGANSTWDSSGVADPYVVVEKDRWYLYYLGMNESAIQRLGVAVSEDGINWTKSASNPILDVGAAGSFDENGLGEPSVYYMAPYYYMLYTGRNAAEQRNIGLAVSLNGIDWKKMSSEGEFERIEAWNSEVICDTTFMKLDDALVVYYGGGNVASPDQNLNGMIGMFELNISQNRDMTCWDANADWSNAAVSSQDVLSGSYEIETDETGGSSWCSAVTEVELYNDESTQEIYIKGWIPVQSLHSQADQKEVSIRVYVNDMLQEEKTFTQDDLFEFAIDKSTDEEWLTVRIEADSEIVPAEVSDSSDERALSYKIYYIGQEVRRD
jgi:hypothetical protein